MLASNTFISQSPLFPSPGRHRDEGLFTPEQQRALREFNSDLTFLNNTSETSEYNHLAALGVYASRHSVGDGALKLLDEAYRKQYGHWVNGEGHKDSLRKIFSRLDYLETHSVSGLNYYRANFAKMQGKIPARRKYGNKVRCLVHPHRSSFKDELCHQCYLKAFKLNILTLPKDQWFVTLLKKRKPKDTSRCVNHANVNSYADGHCVECLKEMGKLKEFLDN